METLSVLAHRGRFYFVRALSGHKIWVRLHQNQNDINNPANAKQANGKQIQDSHADAPFIEFMRTEIPQEQAQEKCRPLIAVFSAHRSSDAHRCTGGCRCAGIIVIDNIESAYPAAAPLPVCRNLGQMMQSASMRSPQCGQYLRFTSSCPHSGHTLAFTSIAAPQCRAMVYRFHDCVPPLFIG